MTNHIHGPSLLQARNYHRHFHSHNHARLLQDENHHSDNKINVARSPNANLDNRQADTTVEVVQTISVVQIIDQTGGVVSATTISAVVPLETISLPDITAAVATAGDSTSLGGASSDGVQSTSTAPEAAAQSTSLASPEPTGSTITASLPSSTLSQDASLTPAPSTSTGFSTLTGASNTTTSARIQSFNNSTSYPLLNTTSASLSSSVSSFGNTSLLNIATTTTSSLLWSSSDAASSWASTTDGSGTAAQTGGGVAGAGGNAGGASATATSTGKPGSTTVAAAGLTASQQSAVIGGVVGGLAGIALVVVALMFILKWKRGQSGSIRLIDGDAPSSFMRGLPSTGGGDSGGSSGGMGEHSSPFAIPATLAALTGHKRASQPAPAGPETTERGFYRVSGRKLTSVLQSGGDGYTEPNPHQSIFSDTSSYRDSQAFFGGRGTIPLQLGSPMRPDSGIPVIRTGPARTPVEEYGPFSPFADDSRQGTPSPPPVPRLDPLGRTLVAHSGSSVSRGSNSRFTENMS